MLLLCALRIVIGFVSVPLAWVDLLSVVTTIVFMATPVYAIYCVAKFNWTARWGLLFLVVGAFFHVGAYFLADQPPSLAQAVISAIGMQFGLVTWCVGLGVLLTRLFREKNLLLPVALFLAVLDMFLVLTPVGPTGRIARENPNKITRAFYETPRVQNVPTGGKARPLAFVGPADFLFVAMFSVALFRFGMRTRETLWWMMGTLVCYLLVTILFGSVHLFGTVSLGALPALVPIGACVLIVNRKEFELSKDEKISTWIVAGLGLGLLIWGATRPTPPNPVLPKQAPAPVKV